MRRTIVLLLKLCVVIGFGTGTAVAQHGPNPQGAPAPTSAARKPATEAKPEAGHGEPATPASAPAKQTSGHADPGKPAASPAAHGPATPATHGAPAQSAAPAAKPSAPVKGKDANGTDLGTAISRIQERILTETGPTARRAATARPVPTPARPAVTLLWKTSLKWPAELQAETTLIPLPPIALEWK